MKDKDIYDLIENIEELDKLSFDYEQWEEFNLSDEDIEHIKSKTYKKMRCESEIRKYLKDKNIDEELCNQIIVKLRKNNLLDDRNYIKSYISDKMTELDIVTEYMTNKKFYQYYAR